jgi:hypothetical protein
VLVLVIGVLAFAPSVARAQATTPQAQFDYGLAEMEAGRFATGCPALAESYRLDPRPGVLFTLAECENKWGKLASALTHYEAYLDLFERMRDEEKAHQRGRDRVATGQRDRLRSEVPQLAIALPPSAPPGTTVTRDGSPLGAPSLGTAAPVDPGEHVVVARTPDGAAHESRVTLARGEHRRLVVDLTTPVPPPAPVPSLAPAPSTALPPPSALRSAAWLSGAVGLAGIAVGAVAGAVVLGDKSTIGSACNPDHTCSSSGLDAASHARTFGLVSDVGFAAGGAALVASGIFFLASSPRAVHPVASVDSRGGFVGVHLTW